MQTECTGSSFTFQPSARRDVVANFGAGRASSDGGVLLLRELAMRIGFFPRVAACFRDHRNQDLIEHPLEALLAQRILGIACGYEDLVDHDHLRDDPLFALASGVRDLEGSDRRRKADRGHALAGKSTLNRLELTPADADERARYKKLVYNPDAFERLFVDVFLDAHAKAPKRIVLDLDATDDPLHGTQEGRFFHGYYGGYCYLPLYVFCGHHLLVAKLRPSNIDASSGALDEIRRLISQLRERWPKVVIVLRADSGFARDELMTYCESLKDVHYVFGLARNSRLVERIEGSLDQARVEHERTGRPARRFRELRYRTLDSWTRERRVVAKAERIAGKDNPRFVVTSIPRHETDAKSLYEKVYCARGDMENRIKEQQLGLFADRTSTHTMRANQLRLWLSSLAYVLVHELRRTALSKTEWACAQVSTIRTKLLKIAAVVTFSVRRVVIAMSSAYPWKDAFGRIVSAIRGDQLVRNAG